MQEDFFLMSVDVSFQIGQCDEYYTQLTFSSSHSALDDHCMIIYISCKQNLQCVLEARDYGNNCKRMVNYIVFKMY